MPYPTSPIITSSLSKPSIEIIQFGKKVLVTPDLIGQTLPICPLNFKAVEVGQRLPKTLFGSQCPGYGKGGYYPGEGESDKIPVNVSDKVIAHMKFIKLAGIKYIISVDDSDDRTDDLKSLWEDYFGGQYITSIDDLNLIIPDYTQPSVPQLFVIVTKVLALLHAGEKVMIHCYQGSGRTGIILAAIAMKLQQIDYRKAIALVRNQYHAHAVDGVTALKEFGNLLMEQNISSSSCISSVGSESCIGALLGISSVDSAAIDILPRASGEDSKCRETAVIDIMKTTDTTMPKPLR